MNKILSIPCLLLLSSFSQADALGIRADVGLWQPDYDGNFDTVTTNLENLGHGDENNAFFHLYIEHPVPLIPNGRISFANITSNKTQTPSQLSDSPLTIDSTVPLTDLSITTNFDLTYVDLTAYYEILDNWINLDLGLSVRQFDGKIEGSATLGSDTVEAETLELDDAIPMAYALLEIDLPFTGWSAGVEGNITDYDDYSIDDVTLKVRYLFDSVLDVGIEAGYRRYNVDISKGTGVNLELEGPFAALAFHF